MEDIKTRFKNAVDKCVTREGIKDLMAWLETTDFFEAPASTKYHGNYAGGLAEHSLSVLNELMFLAKAYNCIGDISIPRWKRDDDIETPRYTPESLAIVALFHDLCKVNMYKTEMRNVKEDDRWVQKPFYARAEQMPYGGHGAKSVYLVMSHMKLTEDEAIAIHNHMGAWDLSSYNQPSEAFEKYPLAWLLHVADESATYIRHI